MENCGVDQQLIVTLRGRVNLQSGHRRATYPVPPHQTSRGDGPWNPSENGCPLRLLRSPLRQSASTHEYIWADSSTCWLLYVLIDDVRKSVDHGYAYGEGCECGALLTVQEHHTWGVQAHQAIPSLRA